MLRTVDTTDVSDPRFTKLFGESFAPEEKIPFVNLSRTFGKGGKLTFYNDGDVFVGFTYSFEDDGHVFLVYIATEPSLRNRGYGSKVLRSFENTNAGKDLFLVVEPVEGSIEEKRLRGRRQAFYERNGWRNTGYRLLSDGVYFDSLYYRHNYPEKILSKVVKTYEDVHNGRI